MTKRESELLMRLGGVALSLCSPRDPDMTRDTLYRSQMSQYIASAAYRLSAGHTRQAEDAIKEAEKVERSVGTKTTLGGD